MKRSRRGLGGALFFSRYRVQRLSDGEVARFFDEIGRIRDGRPLHGRKIALEDMRALPQFSANRVARVRPIAIGAPRASVQAHSSPDTVPA